MPTQDLSHTGNPMIDALAEAIAPAAGIEAGEAAAMVEAARDAAHGDYAFPCFLLAKRLKKAPPAIAAEIAQRLAPGGIVRVARAVGPYVNVDVDPVAAARAVVSRVLDERARYGGGADGAGRTIVIDFSSPNIAKPFGIGHLRSTVIGAALHRLHGALGYRVVGINHLGDWGTQFGKLIVADGLWGPFQAPEGDAAAVDHARIQYFYNIYVRFHEEAKKDATLEDRARAAFAAIERGDPEARRTWADFRDVSLREFRRIYAEMGVLDLFQEWWGEAFYEDKVGPAIDRLKAAGLAVESEGALVVDLADKKMPPCLLRKRDEATLYAARDIAAAEYRYDQFKFDRMLYVVGGEQRLHFQQFFEVLRRAGRPWADRCVHCDFGRILGISTRKGTLVFLEDVLEEGRERAAAAIEAKNPDLSGEEKDRVARAVGLGALVFSDLAKRRVMDVEFNWDRLLAFDGETGPYLQYTHARLSSILRKCGVDPDAVRVPADLSPLDGPGERAVVKAIADLPRAYRRAAREYEPSIVAAALIDCAKAWNSAERDVRVKDAPEPAYSARIALVAALRQTLANGLRVLGIEPLERM